ncbi:Ref family recombination enhancement nuclease [Klebsiella aerogenes]|uniref:Ref family recombination enhancement nuclease n=1 Tax=Klebsiella aerogenes TaxID=548 RepID=UPI001F422503|nr:Ref family recombination enhancement nuclease [Klebsiella aerogenes]
MSRKRTHKTKAEQQHLDRVAALGCIVCRNLGYGDTPAEIHHCCSGTGTAVRASHFRTIPLCHTHHRTGGHGVALHAGQKTWESIYGTEAQLLAQTEIELGGGSLYA